MACGDAQAIIIRCVQGVRVVVFCTPALAAGKALYTEPIRAFLGIDDAVVETTRALHAGSDDHHGGRAERATAQQQQGC